MRMPWFDLKDYAWILKQAKDIGYDIRPVKEMPAQKDGSLYLRHDVDLHLHRITDMAELEAASGVKATYFVMVEGHYNVLLPQNRGILRDLVDMGHEIGYHYTTTEGFYENLKLLERTAATEIRSIVLHEPHLNSDPLKNAAYYVHPHAYPHSYYISDSCRGWRDENLLKILTQKQRSVLLNIHPELWLTPTARYRTEYLEFTTLPAMDHFAHDHIRNHIAPDWGQHDAVRLDTERLHGKWHKHRG